MQILAGQTLPLLDARQQRVGDVTIERSEGDLVLGKFVPGPAFAPVAQLFRAFEEAVEAQALSVVDDLDGAIEALGLHLPATGSPPVAVHDVQIWSDGGISLRLSGREAAPVNGASARREATRPPRE